jgi:uncharacterized YigZ family protein
LQSYKTPGGRAAATITEKKSEFIAHIAHAASEAEALSFLEEIRAAHRTANHNVYAYSLRENARQRYSDDGEPAKTAGLPVLSVLTHAQVVDAIVVVTRYFGGTLFGTGGLVRAYTAASQAALAAAPICTMQQCITLALYVPYPLYESVQRLLQEVGAKMDEPVFTDAVQLSATLPAGSETTLLPRLNELFRGDASVKISSPFFTPFATPQETP